MDSTTTISEHSNHIMNTPEPLKKTGLGAHLKFAREAMRLTEKEAAARLHLNVNIITLIENENFAGGPPATFMRGYLRSYARLLNLSENEITLTLKDLESSMPSSLTSAPVQQLKPAKDDERYFHWLTYVIVLVLLILVSVWWSSHSRYVIADVPPTTHETTDAKTATPTSMTSPAETNTSATATPTTAVLPSDTAPLQMTGAAASSTPGTPPTVLAPPTLAAPETSTAATPLEVSAPISNATVVTPSPIASEITPTVSEGKKPAKKSTLSKLKMALPEPDVDSNQDENNND